jgi:hypothetical protein
LSESDRFIWPITVLDGFAGINWVYPSLPLYASPENLPPASADMRGLLQQGVGAAGRTLVEGQCINGGPNPASNARCQFGGLPAGAIVECDPPTLPVASLASGQSIACSADFPTPATTLMLSLQASSDTTDGATGNNTATVQIIPPATSANLRASLTQGTGATGFTRVDGLCINDGPDAATNATCAFTLLPPNATVSCTPAALPVASLASGASIACVAQCANLTTASTVRLQARSDTTDAQTENNTAALEIPAPPPPPASADLRTGLSLGEGAAGRTLLLGHCTNHGPDAAQNVACAYRGLPAAATVTCNPGSPQASLAADQSIACRADFPNQNQPLSVTIEATSPTADPTPTNDAVAIEVPPQSDLPPLLRDGFESD